MHSYLRLGLVEELCLVSTAVARLVAGAGAAEVRVALHVAVDADALHVLLPHRLCALEQLEVLALDLLQHLLARHGRHHRRPRRRRRSGRRGQRGGRGRERARRQRALERYRQGLVAQQVGRGVARRAHEVGTQRAAVARQALGLLQVVPALVRRDVSALAVLVACGALRFTPNARLSALHTRQIKVFSTCIT